MSVMVEVRDDVESVGLRYTTDRDPGISRRKRGDTFEYLDPNGDRITDEATLERIRSLAIPPAYEQVWICPDPNGHLQATGKDARGRKQYRYHPLFREVREGAKYERLAVFGQCLPEIRSRVDWDLSRRGFPREKVLAVCVNLLERSLIRVGNEEYARENRHFGLTTLRNRHVAIEGSDIKFNFVGKSGVRHRITVHDRRLARVVKGLQDLPGQELFQYVDEDGQIRSVSSSDVNAYLKEISGHDFTAKDFRTWAGTVLALSILVREETPSSVKALKDTISRTVKQVAAELGNTPAVCRKCYIHPTILERFRQGRLLEELSDDSCLEEAVAKLLSS